MKNTRSSLYITLFILILLNACSYSNPLRQEQPERPPGIVVGGSHICRTQRDETVVCWGDNRFGQLGNGTTTPSINPVEVAGLTDVVSLAAGDGHTCAVLKEGGVRCWGANHRGQLGIALRRPSSAPVSVPVGPATQIAAGRTHTCARLSDGTVSCWGDNSDGQVGLTAPITMPVPPAAVPKLTDVISVTTGNEHSCSLSLEGEVYCWGDNHFGQLGHGKQAHQFFPPRPVPIKGPAFAVSAGRRHTCALLSNRTVQCWGENFDGQLGNGTTTQSLLPVQVVFTDLTGKTRSLENVAAVSAGKGHTCALLINREVYCWGSNRSGQLGGHALEISPSPVRSRLSHAFAVAIASGEEYTCAISLTGATQCVGGEKIKPAVPFTDS